MKHSLKSEHRAKKSFGQNFLIDESVIENIVAGLRLTPKNTVIEIGPGKGALTSRLLEESKQVIAIELDRDLIPGLHHTFAEDKKFTLLNDDALTIDFSKLLVDAAPAETKLAANLPYNISTPILQRLTECRGLFDCLVLMFQREVAERITAPAGSKARGYLSVLIENAFSTEHLFDVPPTAFRPVPKVWSSVVRLTPKKGLVQNETLFRSLVSTSFEQKRKTILNNLKGKFDDAALLLAAAGIDSTRRAETITIDEWANLTDIIPEKK